MVDVCSMVDMAERPEVFPMTHNDLIIVNGRKAYIGTVEGYARQYQENETEARDRAIRNGHELVWISLEASVICGDKGYYEAEAAKWAKAATQRIGDIIHVDGHPYRIKAAPNSNFELICCSRA